MKLLLLIVLLLFLFLLFGCAGSAGDGGIVQLRWTDKKAFVETDPTVVATYKALKRAHK